MRRSAPHLRNQPLGASSSRGPRGGAGAERSSAAETPPAVWTAGRKNKRSSYAAIYEKESHYTGKRPPGGASAAGNIEDGVTADAPASDRSGGPVFPSRPTRTFCVQTGKTRQNGADKRVANRPQKAAFPSLRRAADDPPKAEQKRRFTAQKTVQKPPSGGKPSRESGYSEIDETLLRPPSAPFPAPPGQGRRPGQGNLSRGVGFWRKTLDNKVSLC